jgi:outer membrane protein TolC
MRLQSPPKGTVVLALLVALGGCMPQQPYYFHEKGDLSRYIGMASTIDDADVKCDRLSEVEGTLRPLSLLNSDAKEIWELSLEDAIRYALENSKVIRSIGGQIQGPPEFLTRGAEQVPTIYDPAIIQSNPRFGEEAALSLFDTHFLVFNGQGGEGAGIVNRNDPRNTNLNTGPISQVDRQNTFDSAFELRKQTATGALVTVDHEFVSTNAPNISSGGAGSRIYQDDFTTLFRLRVQQPLLQGAGVAFNRIAGPGAIPGFNQGIMLARLNTDIALASFEANVRNLVSDVETAYWEVYFAYRNLDAAVAGRNAALKTWRKVHALFIVGGRGGDKANEAQAREQYFNFRSTVEQSLTALYSAESKLRYIMGLAATDGRLIRPKDEPTTAKVTFDWSESLAEALSRGVELREQKWRIKQRELELIAAKNYLLPKVNLFLEHQWQGLGDNLVHGTSDFRQVGSSAYQSLFSGELQNTSVGLNVDVPLGFRKELTGVRSAQLSLTRERVKLQEMELEVSHQVAYAIRELDSSLVLTQTNFNRRLAAQKQYDAFQAKLEAGMMDERQDTVTFLNLVLQAQRLVAQAESDYYRSLVSYNQAIMRVHSRKNSLLEYNGVYLAEGPWPAKAYFDAKRRARARDAAVYLDYGFTMPRVLSRGPIPQFAGEDCQAGPKVKVLPAPGAGATPVPEPIPAGQTVGPAKAADQLRQLPAPPKAQPKSDAEPATEKPATDSGEPSGEPQIGARPMFSPKGRDLGSLDLSTLGGGKARDQRPAADGWQAKRAPDTR